MQIASIGTQLSEAFAGLDRIRELMEMDTEDEEDGDKAPLGPLAGEVIFEHVELRVQPWRPGSEGRQLHGPGGDDDGAGRIERVRQEHLISLVMAFNRPGRAVFWSTAGISRRFVSATIAARSASCAGQLPLRRYLGDNIRYGRPDATIEQVKEVSRIAHGDEFIEGFEEDTTRSSASGA